MKKICVFDLDGTLVNSLYDLADAMNYALVKNGFEPHEREKYRFMVGNGISSLADRAMVIPKGMATDEQKKQVLADFNEYYTEHSLDKTVPYDGITELLTKLDELSIKYAIMSNKPDKFTNLLPQSFSLIINLRRLGDSDLILSESLVLTHCLQCLQSLVLIRAIAYI